METTLQPKLTHLQARLSKKLTVSLENNFAVLKDRTSRFRQHLADNKTVILKALSSYQSHATSEDEFSRIFECLDSIEELREYLTRRTGSVAVFFPLNMPIYALVLYGIIPSLVADAVYVRAPQQMTNLMRLLKPLLDVETFFPNLGIVFDSREEFVQHYVAPADVVIFTGKLANAQNVMRKCKKNSLFLFNGWGCNPIVIGEGADLDTAAEKTVQARLFSSGQDCAGPDTILVSRNDAADYVAKLKANLKTISIGSYSDPEVVVGALADEAQVRLIGSLFLKSSDSIVYGGTIDYCTKIVHPTIVVSDLSQSMNFEELFAPVIYVSIYDNANQLPRYFEHPSYTANEMYVTLFGSCQYVESLQKSIVVKDQVIFDIDRGNDEFGGYSVGASFVASNRMITPKPLLVPREIYDYLQPGSAGYRLSPGVQAKIGKHVRKAMVDFFSSNLVFGFVFGSVARQEATGSSDINTMVVVAESNQAQTDQYIAWLSHLHEQHQLKFKKDVSALVLTLGELENLVKQLREDEKVMQPPNFLVSTEALSGAQCGVSGNKKLSVEYGRRVMSYSVAAQKKKPVPMQSSDTPLQFKVPEETAFSHSQQVEQMDSNLSLLKSGTVSSPPTTDALKQVDLTDRQAREESASKSKHDKVRWLRAFCRSVGLSKRSSSVMKNGGDLDRGVGVTKISLRWLRWKQ